MSTSISTAQLYIRVRHVFTKYGLLIHQAERHLDSGQTTCHYHVSSAMLSIRIYIYKSYEAGDFFYVWLLLFSNRSFPPCCIAIDTLGFIHRGQSIQYIPGMVYTSLFVGICFSLLSEDFTHIFPCYFADPGAITRQLHWQWIYPKCYREIHHVKLQDVVTEPNIIAQETSVSICDAYCII